MAVLGLRFRARAFSSCGKRGPLFIAVRGPLTIAASRCVRSTGSRCAGSVVVAHGLSCSVACGIFPDRARTHVPCIGRQILNHCATREALVVTYWSPDFVPFSEVAPIWKGWWIEYLKVKDMHTLLWCAEVTQGIIFNMKQPLEKHSHPLLLRGGGWRQGPRDHS